MCQRHGYDRFCNRISRTCDSWCSEAESRIPELNIYNCRHRNVVCSTTHSNCNVKTTCTHSKHTDTATCGSMAIGTDQSLAGNTESFKMHLMANTVAGTGEINTVLFGNGLNKLMVVCVFKAGLERVMINICNTALGTSQYLCLIEQELKHKSLILAQDERWRYA